MIKIVETGKYRKMSEPPQRESFETQEQFEEAFAYWRRNVSRSKLGAKKKR